MTAATQQRPAEAAEAPISRSNSVDELLSSLESCTSLRAAYAAGLAHLADRFEAPYAVLALDVDNNSTQEHIEASSAARASWHRHCDGMMLKSRYHQTSAARFFRASDVARTFAILSVPLRNQRDGVIGAMALVVPCDRREVAAARLSELQSTTAIIDLAAGEARRRIAPAMDAGALSRVAAHQNLEEFCFALTNSLKANLNCDQVALGLVRGTSIKVACISGFDDVYPRSPGTRLIQQAMSECLDAGDIVCCQTESHSADEGLATGHLLHKRWFASLGASPVASIPIFVEYQCVAVVSVRNPSGRNFRRDQLERLQELVAPLMPGLMLLQRADRSTARRVADAVGRFHSALKEPGRWHRKALAATVVAATVWVLFGHTEYRLTAPCTVESSDDLQLSAPFEAVIAEAYVRPGDAVLAGQPIARMDTALLEAEKEKLIAELRMADVNAMQATMAGDVAAGAAARAEAAIARSQLKVTQQKIAAATIRAPSDGVILEGRLESRIGDTAALGDPLVHFAPTGRWQLELHVPQRSAAALAIGQQATAAIKARPESPVSLRIVQVHAASTVEDGRIGFTAEAEFEGTPPGWLRAGMQGIARIDAGRRPIWWVWAHRTIDALRLRLWRL